MSPPGLNRGRRSALSGATPSLTLRDATRLARDMYDVHGVAQTLPAERDQNFLVRTPDDAFVLKLAQVGEDAALLECQNEVLARVAGPLAPLRVPVVRRSRAGREIERHEGPGGVRLVRLLEYIPGRPLAQANPRSTDLVEGTGRLLGRLDAALAGYAHPAARRVLDWDLCRGREVVAAGIGDVGDAARRALVERHLARIEAQAGGLLADLRTGVIHGDGNDWNILVTEPADPRTPAAVSGLVDFGDLVESWVVAEPAIAAAYAMLDRVDPVAAAAAVVRGYHAANALTEPEVVALFPLATLRLCVSVVMSARQRREHPGNEYLSVSERSAWALLERLEDVDPGYARYRLRDACCWPACPARERVVQWLEAHDDEIGPVLDPDPASSRRITLDLSPGSLEWSGLRGREDSAAWTRAVFDRMRDAGAGLGIGRYDEPRRWYTGEAFRTDTDEGPEWRTVHLGIDLFMPAGTPVLAPLDGTVAAVRDNAGRLDYGPTILLRHETDDVVFHTLYGHLAPGALDLEVGRRVRRGERIAAIGAPPGNGDWAPHLHLQIIADLLGYEGTFPGVVRPSERAVWLSVSPDPNLLVGEAGGGGGAGNRPATDSAAEIIEVRRRRMGPNLSISYRRPLHIVRGWMQHLYDADGQVYLDCVNNVAHVGHEHPRVVDALARQAAVLNTNTRYLHENIIRYAERLTATLPEPLSVCYLVNSGSEANELALRLARTHTGRRDVVVLDVAYHGNTGGLVDISPYKFDGPGGSGAPAGTHVVPLPDPYRGRYRGEDTAEAYADHVRDAVEAAAERGATAPRGHGTAAPQAHGTAATQAHGTAPTPSGVAAFFAESIPSCGGQVVLPEGFLAAAYRHVRAAGGVCVADEVQTGLGRVGSHVWAFETQGVVPDIVTMGKPIGNGHPLAAVVTTPEIAASFDNGMEYFNTFGGNPVSCAVGLAVLDVMEEEGLQARASGVGEHFMAGLRGLMDRHALIGDVRGLGLFIGVELVLDRDTREPATLHTEALIERMRDHGILLSTDGPDGNVLKIKPPLQFSEADAERVVATLDRVLGEDAFRLRES
ncbi:MAG: aminotransferase class III-fold pyridoxal phosphate-dependent enzyme [Gemmatimonadota bacterium]